MERRAHDDELVQQLFPKKRTRRRLSSCGGRETKRIFLIKGRLPLFFMMVYTIASLFPASMSKTRTTLSANAAFFACRSSSSFSYRRKGPTGGVTDSSLLTTTTTTILFMGKGDGRQKRKKKSPSSSSSDSSSSSGSTTGHVAAASSSAPRVSNDINIPVRRQIAWANLNKEYRREMAQKATGSFRQKNTVRTKFRKNVNETELAELLDWRKRNRDLGMNETSWNATSGKPPPLLLVDGYNIIHKWARLKKHLHRGDLYHARELLIADLEQLQSWKHWTIECVFDGAGSGSGGGTTATASRFGNVQVVFTGRGVETADAYVEQTCQRVAATGASVMVASDDAVIRSVIQGYGQEGQNWNAIHMSADRLIDELKASRAVISYLVEATVANINGHGIRPAALRSTSAMTGFTNRPVFVQKKKNETKQDDEIADVVAGAATTAVEDDDDIALPSAAAPAPTPAASRRQKPTSKTSWIVL